MSTLTKRDRYEGVGVVFTTSRASGLTGMGADEHASRRPVFERTYTGLIVSTIAGVMFMARPDEILGDKPAGHSEVLTRSLGVIVSLYP